MTRDYFTNDTGQIFVVFKSSTGYLNVSLNTGSGDFLGYVRTIGEAKALIARKFGGNVRPV